MKKFLALFAAFVFISLASSAYAAANPFADVPAGHWAYDAVAQLAADGLISGYPDGTFKGPRQATRYEVAAMTARAVARADELHAGKKDLELLKKLVLEFKDELDALGVKVNKLDKRVGTLEQNMGGWKINGTLIFDASFSDKGWYNYSGGRNEFTKNVAALSFMKFIDQNTFFMGNMRMGFDSGQEGRGDISNIQWNIWFVNTKLPYDIDLRVGRWYEDFELWNNLYWAGHEKNSLFGCYRMDGFRLHKSWGQFEATAAAARNTRYDANLLTILGGSYIPQDTAIGEYMHYLLNLQWQPNERFKLGGLAYWWNADGGRAEQYDLGYDIYGIYADVALTQNINLKGVHYWQKLNNGFTQLPAYTFGKMKGVDTTSPTAWKAILDINQKLLKFTSLWVEYTQISNSFTNSNQQHVMDWSEYSYTPAITDNMPYGWDGTTKLWMVGADQRWNAKWLTFEKYSHADYGKDWVDDANNFTVGVTYQYTPAMAFSLIYDYIDYGDGAADPLSTRSYRSGSDHIIKFRTAVHF